MQDGGHQLHKHVAGLLVASWDLMSLLPVTTINRVPPSLLFPIVFCRNRLSQLGNPKMGRAWLFPCVINAINNEEINMTASHSQLAFPTNATNYGFLYGLLCLNILNCKKKFVMWATTGPIL